MHLQTFFSAKKKFQVTKEGNEDRQTVIHKTLCRKIKHLATWTPLKTGGEICEGKQFLVHKWHLSCNSCSKSGDNAWNRKGGRDYDYDNRYIVSNLLNRYSVTGDLLKEVQFIWNFLWYDNKRWPFNTGDFLIEVTTWAGSTVYNILM
jgi:hypothetical protein